MFQLGMRKITLLPGFRVRVKPISRPMRVAATTAYAEAKAEAEEAGEAEKEVRRIADTAFDRSLAINGIVDWESFAPENPDTVLPLQITDPSGNPADVTPDNILMLMDYDPAAEAFREGYVLPFLIHLAAKNVSAPSSNGSSSQAEAKATAEAA